MVYDFFPELTLLVNTPGNKVGRLLCRLLEELRKQILDVSSLITCNDTP